MGFSETKHTTRDYQHSFFILVLFDTIPTVWQKAFWATLCKLCKPCLVNIHFRYCWPWTSTENTLCNTRFIKMSNLTSHIYLFSCALVAKLSSAQSVTLPKEKLNQSCTHAVTWLFWLCKWLRSCHCSSCSSLKWTEMSEKGLFLESSVFSGCQTHILAVLFSTQTDILKNILLILLIYDLVCTYLPMWLILI